MSGIPIMNLLRGFLVAAWCAFVSPALVAVGSGSLENTFVHEQSGLRVTVRYFVPDGGSAQTPVIFVMHGVKRNGDDYFRDWVPHARAKGFLLIVPEFSAEDFPGDEGYNFGNTVDAGGRPLPRERWSFSMIEPIFDAVRARTGNRSVCYSIYGHSAGAQFVHRFLYFVPDAHIGRIVSANAGWYTLPTLDVAFPYGLGNTPVTESDLKTCLARPLTILLGTADNDPNHRMLRHTPEAEAQGPHRLARGHYFFDFARTRAAALGVPFSWSIATAPDISHSDKGMAPFALTLLLAD